MATSIADAPAAPRPKPDLAPTGFDRILAYASIALLLAVFVALARGRAEWSLVPGFVWAHVGTIAIALALTPAMMLRRRGDWLHRRLGWVWCAALFLTAALTFGIRGINHGSLSLIHILSAWTMLQVPLIVWNAKAHKVEAHRRAVRGVVTGALLIAGIFTFPPMRLFGEWLYG